LVALSLVAGSPVIGSPSLPSAYAFGLEDRVLDFGLHVLDAEADKFYLCSKLPTTYAEVLSLAFGVPWARETHSGRQRVGRRAGG
jgi:hypothetical protein